MTLISVSVNDFEFLFGILLLFADTGIWSKLRWWMFGRAATEIAHVVSTLPSDLIVVQSTSMDVLSENTSKLAIPALGRTGGLSVFSLVQ